VNINKQLLFEDVEKPGKKYPPSASEEITLRYALALNYASNKDVLELGFGYGYGIKTILKIAKSYYGIDYLHENVDALKKKYHQRFNDNFQINQGDAQKTLLNDKCKDLIIAFAIIYYLDFDIFLEECSRVLKNNGKLIFCQTNPDHKYFQPSRNTISYYTYSEILTKLKKYGFKATILAKIEDTKINKNNISNLKKFFSSNSLLKNILIFLRKQLFYKKIPDILPIDSYQSELGKLKEINKDTNLTDIRVMYFVCSKL